MQKRKLDHSACSSHHTVFAPYDMLTAYLARVQTTEAPFDGDTLLCVAETRTGNTSWKSAIPSAMTNLAGLACWRPRHDELSEPEAQSCRHRHQCV